MALKFEILKNIINRGWESCIPNTALSTRRRLCRSEPAAQSRPCCRNRWNRPGLKLFWVIHITLCCGRELIWWKNGRAA